VLNIRTKNRLFSGAILVSGLLLAGGFAAKAQNGHVHNNGQRAEATTTSTAGVIDGAVNPGLISDQEAITMFWISIMEQPTSGAME
jgi:hypothetical protein